MSVLQEANRALRDKDYKTAIQLYEQSLREHPELQNYIEFNIKLAYSKCAEQRSLIVDIHTNKECKNEVGPHVLFVLPGKFDSGHGYQVQLLARMLQSRGLRCTIAISDIDITRSPVGLSIESFSALTALNCHITFDLIHAWTPRETVRKFTEKMLAKNACPLIIHLAENEEYRTEAIAGQPYSSLVKLSETALAAILSDDSYHPKRGQEFINQADGLTMNIQALERFNTSHIPALVLPPLVDERFFYPRPLHNELRKELDIPEGSVVLVYSGGVSNPDEIGELYEAVGLLNQQNCPTVLLVTGIESETAIPSGKDNGYIRHLGWLEREQVADVLAAADILVQPGAPSPFNDQHVPYNLMEYFAMGRPVILPKNNLGLRVAHGEDAWVIDRANAENIVQAVRKIVADKKLSQKLADKAVDFYLDNRDWMVDAGAFYTVFLSPQSLTE